MGPSAKFALAIIDSISKKLHRNVEGQWKFKSMTYLPTNQRTYGLTWVGARDTCVSKKILKKKSSELAPGLSAVIIVWPAIMKLLCFVISNLFQLWVALLPKCVHPICGQPCVSWKPTSPQVQIKIQTKIIFRKAFLHCDRGFWGSKCRLHLVWFG